MKRLVVKSFKEDLNGFLNLVPNRIKAINESSNEPLPSEYGVNKLASSLHPSALNLTVTNIYDFEGGAKVLTLVDSDNKKLPFFRAGQNINIKSGSFSSPFSLMSAPGSNCYEIAVFPDSEDIVSQYLIGLTINSKIISSGPEGLFYYISLRDKNKITAFCDNYGAPALISMARSIAKGTDNYSLKIIYFDKNGKHIFRDIIKELPVSVEYVSTLPEECCVSDKSFISGTNEFCNLALQKFPNSRINVVNPPQYYGKANNEYKCTVTYRDKKFVFTCKDNETLLSAFERNSVPSSAKCKTGECGYCRCKLIDGDVETVNIHSVNSLREADKKYNFIHPCRSFAKSDLILAL